MNSSRLPTHICVLLERILDFNGLLESAQASLKQQLTPDYRRWTPAKLTLETFTVACQYNLQTAGHKYHRVAWKQQVGKRPQKAFQQNSSQFKI